MKVAGLISGTSHDGIDVAIVDFTLDGDVLIGDLLATSETPYSPGLRSRIVGALPPAATTMEEVCQLETLIGQEFAAAAAVLAGEVGGVDYACTHGQTLFHWVEEGETRSTLQVGHPAWLAEALGCPVVSGVRMADVAAGGSGAPLVPILDQLLFSGQEARIGLLNLGGISNVTILGAAQDPVAYDIGPANALIDAVVAERGLHPAVYDEGGRIASSGRVDERLLADLLAEEYYGLPAPKSTGKELFHLDYVRQRTGRVSPGITDQDLVATLTELTVRTVVNDLAPRHLERLAVSGGGSHNPVIMSGLAAGLPHVRVGSTDELGVPVDAKEAIAFALIGWLTAHSLPGNVPSITGASGPRILGTVTPGPGGYAGERAARAPASMVLRDRRR